MYTLLMENIILNTDALCLGLPGLSWGWVPGQPGLYGPLLHSQPQPRLQVLDAWRVHWPGQGPPQSHLLHQARLPQSVQWLDHQIFLQVRDKLWYYITNTAHTDSLSIYCLFIHHTLYIINHLHLIIIKLLILTRINYDVACNMDFHKFPVDEQYCEVKFESFGYQTSVSIHTPFKQRRGLTLTLDLWRRWIWLGGQMRRCWSRTLISSCRPIITAFTW
mgnify:CR=1 FL=1